MRISDWSSDVCSSDLAATENAVGARRNGRILKVILFGSYARGDWVEAPQDANQYRSDYDILVIVNQNELADRATYWADAERRISDAYLLEKVIKKIGRAHV